MIRDAKIIRNSTRSQRVIALRKLTRIMGILHHHFPSTLIPFSLLPFFNVSTTSFSPTLGLGHQVQTSGRWIADGLGHACRSRRMDHRVPTCINGGSGREGSQKSTIGDLKEETMSNQCVFVRTIHYTLSGNTTSSRTRPSKRGLSER